MEGTLGLFAGAVGLGLLHGIEPGHGWPVAAGWASARRRRWQAGVLAAGVIGLGHLLSSIAVVVLFFVAKNWLDFGDSRWLDGIAGGLLLGLAAWQLRGVLRTRGHHHHHHDENDAPGARAGIGALALFAFTLGFAHEEEFQIIALCTGSSYCLELMLAYAVAVVLALMALTLMLVAGLARFSHKLEHAEHWLQLLSALILALMGVGFFLGWF
jgi:nickel/cobalt exporter